MYYTYILQLSNGLFYIGYSADLKQRLVSHQTKDVYTTKNKEPRLIWYAAFQSQKKALDFEKYLKSSSGFAFRNKHFI